MKSIGIFSGTRAEWRPLQPGEKVCSIAVFGGSIIDFRQAKLEENVTKVVAFSLFGGNKIIVPPDMPVNLSGFSIFGGKSDERSEAKEPSASAKALNVNAISIFGGCTVTDKSKGS